MKIKVFRLSYQPTEGPRQVHWLADEAAVDAKQDELLGQGITVMLNAGITIELPTGREQLLELLNSIEELHSNPMLSGPS